MPARPVSPSVQRIQTAIELLEIAEDMLRQRLRRSNPNATDEAIEDAVRTWHDQRPGAELGDAPGRPRSISDR